jgi:hypothetical protein
VHPFVLQTNLKVILELVCSRGDSIKIVGRPTIQPSLQQWSLIQRAKKCRPSDISSSTSTPHLFARQESAAATRSIPLLASPSSPMQRSPQSPLAPPPVARWARGMAKRLHSPESPPCSPQMPTFSFGRVILPCSVAQRISSPTPLVSSD